MFRNFFARTALVSRDEADRAMSAWLDTVMEARALAKRCAKKADEEGPKPYPGELATTMKMRELRRLQDFRLSRPPK